MAKKLDVLVSVCGGWWSVMSGAFSIPLAALALAWGGSPSKWFAVLAFAGLLFFAIRVVRQSFLISESTKREAQIQIEKHAQEIKSIKENKAQKDAMRIAISRQKMELEKVEEGRASKHHFDSVDFDNVTEFIRESIKELQPVVADLEPFIQDKDGLHALWLSYKSEYKRSNEFNIFTLEVSKSYSKQNPDKPQYDPIQNIQEYLDKFDSYAK